MPYGYNGKILHIDLTRSELTVEEPPESFYRKYLGGSALEGPRHIWWNFVSSRKERIEEAKEDWKSGRFRPVPGETDFIPLPTAS